MITVLLRLIRSDLGSFVCCCVVIRIHVVNH